MTATPPGDRPDVPVALAARWTQAQGQLFGVLSMQPELYERVVVVLAGTMQKLRELTPTESALLDAQEWVTGIVRDQASAHGLDECGIDAVQVGQAALAQRLPEVRALEANRQRAANLARARTGAGGWVVLEESGDPGGDVLAPYRRLEAEAVTGVALLVRTEPDELFTGCLHTVEPLRVDLATGALLPSEDPAVTGKPTVVADPVAREELVARLRGA